MLSKNNLHFMFCLLLLTLTMAGCASKSKDDIANVNSSNRSEEEEDLEAELLSQGSEIDISLVDVFFGYDRFDLNSDITAGLDQNAVNINSNTSSLQAVVVEGYCDTRGTEEYNLTLGQKRAESVKSYLVKKGVPADMVQTISKGETEKWGPGTSEDAYQQNRRAHFIALGI